MNELITTINGTNGDILVSGRELHDFLGVSTPYHKWMPRMIDYGFVENTDYQVKDIFVHNSNGGKQTMIDHHLKLDMAKEIAMIQRSEKGKQARHYFLQLEKMWNSPEMVMKRALEYADKKVLELKGKIELDKPKVLFADSVSSSKTSILVGELAKLIKQNGVDIGQKRLFDWLRENGYLIKRKGTDYNMPTQKSMDLGIFEIKETSITHSDGHISVNKTPKVTGKGQVYFINKFLNKEKSPVRQH